MLLSALLLGFSMIANAGDSLSINVANNEPSFTVTLEANPTTGYQWSVVQFDKQLFTLSKSHYQRSTTNLIGAGGEMNFTFSLNTGRSYPKQTNMVFNYARSWESGSSTAKNVTVNFVDSSKSQ